MTEERLNILIIEDDECMRALIALHLTEAGYAVSEAEDALVAGRALLQRTPDLLIVDVSLPYMTGLDFVATLIADVAIPRIPVILMTEHEEFAAKADILGTECLVKPFVKTRLIEAVAATLVRAQRRDAKSPVAQPCDQASAGPPSARVPRPGRRALRPPAS